MAKRGARKAAAKQDETKGVTKTRASAASERIAALVAEHGRQIKKLGQEINRIQAIPRTSEGVEYPLGNAKTPPPAEPTQNEPGSVMFQSPPDPAAKVPSKPVKLARVL